ncbi:hypothetical protein J6590_075856 [Homalodisca vitripennis]|nr:hypothetical protein J6590_075856 [Homalodisca vitripennis]
MGSHDPNIIPSLLQASLLSMSTYREILSSFSSCDAIYRDGSESGAGCSSRKHTLRLSSLRFHQFYEPPTQPISPRRLYILHTTSASLFRTRGIT